MKTKFLLTLLALNGLVLSAGNASAVTVSVGQNNLNISSLSHTIGELANLDPDSHSLIESAIHRALMAKAIPDGSLSEVTHTDKHRVHGKIIRHPKPPIIHGIIRHPNPKHPTIHGIIRHPQVEHHDK
jgi:hypothetical protein